MRSLASLTAFPLLLACTLANNATGSVHVPADAATIQAGIDLAAAGDTVVVAPGAYTGPGNKNLTFGKDIVLLAEGGPAVTVIDCEGSGRGLYFASVEGPSCRVEGFRIENGRPPEGEDGGGMLCTSASPTIVNCEFRGNQTIGFYDDGGGAYVYSGNPVFEGCVFAGNSAFEGGGLEIHQSCSVVVRQCTFTGNVAEGRGGGVMVRYDSDIEIDRCIVWGNCAGGSGQEVGLAGQTDEATAYCSLFGLTGIEGQHTYDGEQLFEDPRFCVPIYCTDAPTLDGEFTLGMNSPCLPPSSPCADRIGARDPDCADVRLGACCFSDRPCRIERPDDCGSAGGSYAGDDVACDPDPCVELLGACCLDMETCAYLTEQECLSAGGEQFRLEQPCEPIPCDGLVLRVPDDFSDIQDAIDAAFDRDTVLVAPGTYTGPGNRGLEFFGKSVQLLSEGGADATILDCELADRALYFKHGETAATVVQGFSILNGALTGSGKGAGVACVGGSSPTIRDCVIADCQAEDGGGGVYVRDSAPQFHGCSILGNVSSNRGGGVWAYQANPVFASCRIAGNRAVGTYGGGGVHDEGSNAQFIDCEISANEAMNGAGLRTLLSSPTLTGCTITGNRAAPGNGGGFFLGTNGGLALIDCTVADNRAANGGGIAGGPADLTRTILWGNCADNTGDQIVVNGAAIQFTCCDVDSGGLAGNGTYLFVADNLFENPLFCGPRSCNDAPIGPYEYGLVSGSPCLPQNSPCGELIGARGETCIDPITPGACCLGQSSCTILYEPECIELDGTYLGDGVVCEPNPCPGACCFEDHQCTFVAESDCTDQGGTCWRAGIACDPLPCPMVYRVPSEYGDIQAAVDAACPGTTVLVADGIYRNEETPGNGNIDPGGKDLRLVSENGSQSTILELSGGRGFVFQSGESRDFLLQGFTIRSGYVSETFGGGIACDHASPTVVDCVVDQCAATGLVYGRGGGVACIEASPAFVQCSITRCMAYYDTGPGGGGIYVRGGAPEFRQCDIRANHSYGGGGVYIHGEANASFLDCVVAGNYAGDGGGILLEDSPGTALEGCTVSGNRASSYGGGLQSGSMSVTRSILWGNCNRDERADLYVSSGEVTLACSAVDTSGVSGPGNVIFEDGFVWVDPLFCAPAPCDSALTLTGAYTLDTDSPCLPLASPCGELIGALGVGCPTSGVEPAVAIPTELRLRGPWPNPASSASFFQLELPVASHVRANVVDVRGAVVAHVLDGDFSAGVHAIQWPRVDSDSDRKTASGVYWIVIQGDGWRESRSVTVVR
ncbi:MAG: right-handed parallel beta-helix repeat-containing protein [Candidatus Eisenbacteria bacterium]|nr:right-handed parallel beta-helix repeat-containing protein [Candidatus Eisenbacteria bacterium]